VRAGPDALRRLLVGADRRSLARSNEALALLRADPTRIADRVSLVEDHDGWVALRAVDLLEKLAHEPPESIQPHRTLFIGRLAQHPSWEIRLQIACAVHPQKFVKAWRVDSLSRFAADDASPMSVVESMLADFECSASPALRSRARRIRTRLRVRSTAKAASGP
jgi:hypothetical protein